MITEPSADNPTCPDCDHPKTMLHTQIVKTFSYKCPECGSVFRPPADE